MSGGKERRALKTPTVNIRKAKFTSGFDSAINSRF